MYTTSYLLKVPPKGTRISEVIELLKVRPACSSYSEAYKMLNQAIVEVEDRYFGPLPDEYEFHVGPHANRMSITSGDSIFPVVHYSKVKILISTNHITFISEHGAIEIQNKDRNDRFGLATHFNARKAIITKLDTGNHTVWHEKNL